MTSGKSEVTKLERSSNQPWGFRVDQRRKICGLWLADPEIAKNKDRLKMILASEKAAGREITLEMYAAIELQAFDMLTDSGGVTLWWDTPSPNMPWWQFWKWFSRRARRPSRIVVRKSPW